MRISRPQLWMSIAEAAAMRSTCFRGNVGAVIVKDRDIVSLAYNGPPSGEEHCRGNDCAISTTGGCMRSDHAEHNALERAILKIGIGDKVLATLPPGCDMYCTYSPCLECATKIRAGGIDRFFYRYSYRLPEGLDLLAKSARNIPVYRVTPAGMIVDVNGDIVAAQSLE